MKLAAIGVINVPQNPAVIPNAPTISGLRPFDNRNELVIPVVITEKAAKALPIIIVNIAIAKQYAIIAVMIYFSFIKTCAYLEVTHPTFAAVNTAPSPVKSWGKLLGPTFITILLVSSIVSFAFGLNIIIATISEIIAESPNARLVDSSFYLK